MNLHISDIRTIAEVKADFNKLFPYLRLEFNVNASERNGRTTSKNRISDDVKIGSIRDQHLEATFEFNENSTVEEFENNFFEKFGMRVQVYRRSGNVWLETNMTDKWTLQRQNEHGREITEI